MPKFHIIVAVDRRGGIGKEGGLPWHLPGDLAFFRRKTTQVEKPGNRNAVIMGRKTWDSIPEKFRPLKGRLNIVISRQPALAVPADVVVVGNLEDALAAASKHQVENIFVIGGGSIYREACNHPDIDSIFLTDVHGDFSCDTFFPLLADEFVRADKQDSSVLCENGIEYEFKVFQRFILPDGNHAFSQMSANNEI
jgi:dihydrofolate reductase